jgi:hypothetical protein
VSAYMGSGWKGHRPTVVARALSSCGGCSPAPDVDIAAFVRNAERLAQPLGQTLQQPVRAGDLLRTASAGEQLVDQLSGSSGGSGSDRSSMTGIFSPSTLIRGS